MYKFHLESLLNHRTFLEEALQKELAELKKVLDSEKRDLSSVEFEKSKCEMELAELQQVSLDVYRVILFQSYLLRLGDDIRERRERVNKALRAFEMKRQALVEAMKKRKSLEKLKETGMKIYHRDLGRQERKAMDEVSLSRFNRRLQQNR
jgi:flagellar protein FliJ